MNSMMIKALFVALASAAALASCSSEPTGIEGEANTTTGGIEMDLRVGRSTQLNLLKYTLVGPNGFDGKGSIDISRSLELVGKIANVPAGGPYTLSLTAASTDGNVTCTGSKSGITVSCNTSHDKTNLRLTCTRNHLGREWGDRDWRSNGRTFFLGADIRFSCPADAGTDAAADGPREGGTDGSDGCVPLTACPSIGSCGMIPDHCGGLIDCGTCHGLNQICSNNQCVTPAPCGPTSNTVTCVQSVNPPGSQACSQCVVDSGCFDPAFGGGSCESVAGTQSHFSGVLPDGKTCSAVFQTNPPTESQVCLQALQTMFNSHCAQSGSIVPCLCGTTDTTACLNGQVAPNGPLFDLHACDVGVPSPIVPVPSAGFFGASMAEQIVLCASAFGCDCFGCVPITACPAGQTCGVANNGCGGVINCGSCPAGQTCGGGGTPGQCGSCMPVSACPAGACGSISDGCGGSLTCSGCAAGQTCGSLDHACHDLPAACSPTGSTAACLATRNKPGQDSCSQCMNDVGCFVASLGGGTCEDVGGTLPHFGGTLPDGRSCAASSSAGPAVLISPSETEPQICLQTLGAIFASQCAAPDGTLGPCLCGDVDPAACISGTTTPRGPQFDLYACDVNSPSIGVVTNDFVSPAFGIGMANMLVQCAGAFGCNCF